MRNNLLILLFIAIAFACNNAKNGENKISTPTKDTLKKETKKLEKFADTIFIKHDSDWTGEKLRYVTDTIIFKSGMRRNILVGTTVLSGTGNQYNAYWSYGLSLKKVAKTDCQKSAEEYEGQGGKTHNQINSITATDSSLSIDITFFDNCCYDFLCDVAIVDETILNLVYTGYGTHCDCDCCYGLIYQLSKEKNNNYKKLKQVMINGNRKTLKKLN